MAKDQNPAATRQAILGAAFNLFYHNGFQATGLAEIGENAGVSKGAIYNHFPSKLELGYAIVDEVLHEYVLTHWMAAYQELDDPIEATLAVMDKARGFISESEFNLGCPLNNLVQEMASIDEGFRNRLNQLTVSWVRAVATSFRHAQDCGSLRPDFNPDEIAGFVVTVFEGTMGLVKCARSAEYLEQNRRQLHAYLKPLRQSPPAECDSQSTSEGASSEEALFEFKLDEGPRKYKTTPNLYDEKQD